MLSKRMEEALNAQVNAEFWSAYLYLSMSMYFENIGYKGIAHWFAVQFKEEQDHATIFINHINSRDGKVTLMPIDKVDTSWDSILHAFEGDVAGEDAPGAGGDVVQEEDGLPLEDGRVEGLTHFVVVFQVVAGGDFAVEGGEHGLHAE